MVKGERFRDDLLARINLWTFRLPGLRERVEDIEPNLQYELDQYAQRTGARVTFSREARALFLRFAVSREARWAGNFRDLNGIITRLATLAPGGRISTEMVEEEIDRLREIWQEPAEEERVEQFDGLVSAEQLMAIDLFDRLQLAAVLRVCRESRSLSEAGRALFTASRGRKKTVNDADRLRKFLARFGLQWAQIHPGARP
jgi:transcriptional regulatory protein RtcR